MVAIINYVGNLEIITHDNYFQSYPIYPFLNFPFVCCSLKLAFWFCYAYCCGCLVVQVYEKNYINNLSFHDVDQFIRGIQWFLHIKFNMWFASQDHILPLGV
jgi:hypothetical protein